MGLRDHLNQKPSRRIELENLQFSSGRIVTAYVIMTRSLTSITSHVEYALGSFKEWGSVINARKMQLKKKKNPNPITKCITTFSSMETLYIVPILTQVCVRNGSSVLGMVLVCEWCLVIDYKFNWYVTWWINVICRISPWVWTSWLFRRDDRVFRSIRVNTELLKRQFCSFRFLLAFLWRTWRK